MSLRSRLDRLEKSAPPAADSLALADLADLAIVPPEDWVVAELKAMLAGIGDNRLRARVGQVLAPLLAPADARKWTGTPQHQFWLAQAAASGQSTGTEAYRLQLTDYLARLMCRARWSNGAVASGTAKRAQGQHFRGDMAALYDRLKAKDCPASETASRKVLRDLASAVDIARSQ